MFTQKYEKLGCKPHKTSIGLVCSKVWNSDERKQRSREMKRQPVHARVYRHNLSSNQSASLT